MIRVNFINIQGLQNNAENLQYFNKHDIDVSFILEMWLSPNLTTPFFQTNSNLLTINSQVIAGGHRHSGGILSFAKDVHAKRQVRVVYEDPQSRFVAVKIDVPLNS